ncbi:hypothetical protein VC188_03055 [Polynucleobacter sp. MG-28-Ekke-A2]|uniref:hypothetical protein n=1 Tax=Polynucleobacter sp. MG-28-Ekke-A2 TaxID=3108276 RepID=UPI002B23354E|nr:hypothetical protein [Polynucleobacter sp. MG-28-Ekke-A2]MEA9601102.1 hypothetical protein [Polynucleobacter sp. MG-28-Ekke-A2]
MNQPSTDFQQRSYPENEAEISLLDIVNFLQASWKKLILASVVGAVLGLGGWFVLGSYSAEYVLLNNNNNNNNNSYALDLVSWKMLQKSLPNLADQMIEENKAPENQASLFRAMSSDAWWQKNAVPSYALSKADTKDLAGISKDLDAASTTILNLTLTATGSSKEQSIDNARAVSQFLRSGGAYLQLRSLLNGYESQTISTAAEVQQKIANAQIELGYQRERVKALEELHKRYPNSPTGITVNQQLESGSTNGKYLPLTSQIIAANTDINQSKEDIVRLQRRLDQIALTKTFLDQALPLQDQTFDGLVLDKQLLEIESSLRAKLASDDSNGVEFLNELHAQLLAIQVRFTKGLEANTAPTSSGKKGMTKSTVGGLAAAFFLMLLVLLGGRVWQTIKSGGAK